MTLPVRAVDAKTDMNTAAHDTGNDGSTPGGGGESDRLGPGIWKIIAVTVAGAFMTAPQRIRTLIPEYCRPVAAFFGMASGAFVAAVPQGWTQGTRPASSSAMILPVISL